MEIICTRPDCTNPHNYFSDLDREDEIRIVQQRYCTSCNMPLLLADRYIPSKLLGKGGFGAAFLACDRYKPNLPLCVVKQFQPLGNLDVYELHKAQELFQREAEVLEKLGSKHPQIPHLYAFFTPIVPNDRGTGDKRYFYLAQEFIDGQDLQAELKAKGTFSEAEVVEILTEVLKILQFVHDNNVIHRDIKPSNIMRSKQGVLYLLDFGAVKQVAVSGNKKISGNTCIYSEGFAPPEQMSGLEIYPCTDIYALAVTCITLLTNKPVEELFDSFNNRWNWHNFAPDTSNSLTAIFNKMLSRTPADRFQSATEALNALTLESVTSDSTSNSNDSVSPLSSTPVPTTKTISSPLIRRNRSSFSLVEIFAGAAFTGFVGALLYVGLTGALSVSGVSLGIWGMTMGGIIFALYRRIIEKFDLIVFAGISAVIIAFVPGLQNIALSSVFIIAVISAAVAIAVTAFFRLVYLLLSRYL